MDGHPHPEATEVVISVNPTAGVPVRARVDRLTYLLQKKGLRTTVLTDLDAVAAAANELFAAGSLRALVGVGGDGTAAELVNRTACGVPLAMLSAGNENLLARHIRLDRTPERVCEAIMAGQIRRLDAARANGRIFLLMLGCGFDAEVVNRVHAQRTGSVSRQTYIKPTLDVLRSYSYPALEVRFDGDAGCDSVQPLVLRWLFVFNLPCYAGGLKIAPHADGTDGQLDLCGFVGGGFWRGLGYAAAVACGCHRRLASWRTARANRMTITAHSTARVPYQLDGDPGGTLPVEVEAVPRRLTLIVPKQ